MTIQQNYPAIKSSLNLDFANTKQLDPRITYSRASTGTYYDGKTVAKAEENLLVRSDEFSDVIWTKDNSSVTTNSAVAPDGTTTADTVIASATTSTHRIYQTISTTSNISTVSVYAKAFGLSWVRLNYNGNATANFDLTNGVVGTVAAGTTATITAVGNGWYRCTTTTTNLSGNFIIDLGTSDAGTGASAQTFTGNGTSGIYLWGAQLEQRSSATAYAPTTTAPITNYIPVLQTASAGTPRFDHNPITGESLGLLIEEQRTNLLTYSQDFDNPAWAKNSASVLANTLVSPDGLSSADAIIENTANTEHFIQRESVTVTSGVAYTISAYVKAIGTNRAIRLFIFQASSPFTTFASIIFNPSTGVVDGASIGTTTVVNIGNGWWRISSSATVSATAVGVRAALRNGTDFVYTGDGTSGIYIWGAQLEAGAFATSYIPTVASQVTRAADSASMTGTNFSSWYNPSEGTLYASASSYIQNLSFVTIAAAVSNNTSLTSAIRLERVTGDAVRVVINQDGADVSSSSSWPAGVARGIAAAYKTSGAAVAFNGSLLTLTSVKVPVSPIFLYIGSTGGVGNFLSGHVQRIAYYPRRLTNTQIQSLTT